MKLLFLRKLMGAPKRKTAGRGGVSYLKDDLQKMKKLYDRIEKTMEEKQPYLDGDFSVEDLSSMVCASKAATSRCLSRVGKTNFRPYINNYRVKYSILLIKKEPRMRLSEVARQSGFNSIPSFNTWFKSVTSMCPSEYLAELSQPQRPRFFPMKRG